MSNCTYVGPARRLPVLGMLCSGEEIRASEAFHSAFVFRCRSGRQRRSMATLAPRNCAVCYVEFTPQHRDSQTHCSRSCMQRRPRPRVSLEERFWRYLTPGQPDECWEWQGSRDQNGYGRIQRGGRYGGLIKAHRASLEIHRGPIPEGMVVCHRCDNPPCCNPAHLFLGSMRDNSQDMAAKGRTGVLLGEAHAKTRVTDAQIREIRQRAAGGEPYKTIAPDFDVTPKWVSAVVVGERRPSAGGPIAPKKNRGPRPKVAA